MLEPHYSADALRRIDIALDHYDDIFSDFDPSPYSERTISEDFATEIMHRHAMNKKGELQIRFTLPAKLRNAKTEALVRKRVKEYFLGRVREVEEKILHQRQRGLKFFVAGFAALALVVVLTSPSLSFDRNFLHIAEALLTPVGWFGLWEGTNNLVEATSKFEDEKLAMERFSRANLVFMSQERVVSLISRLNEFIPEAQKEQKQGESSSSKPGSAESKH